MPDRRSRERSNYVRATRSAAWRLETFAADHQETQKMLDHYNSILNTMRGVSPTPHVAGGAVRDSLLDREIKDIDLFLAADRTDDAAALMRSRFGYVRVGEWANYAMFSDPAVVRVAKFEKADELVPVCL